MRVVLYRPYVAVYFLNMSRDTVLRFLKSFLLACLVSIAAIFSVTTLVVGHAALRQQGLEPDGKGPGQGEHFVCQDGKEGSLGHCSGQEILTDMIYGIVGGSLVWILFLFFYFFSDNSSILFGFLHAAYLCLLTLFLSGRFQKIGIGQNKKKLYLQAFLGTCLLYFLFYRIVV